MNVVNNETLVINNDFKIKIIILFKGRLRVG